MKINRPPTDSIPTGEWNGCSSSPKQERPNGQHRESVPWRSPNIRVGDPVSGGPNGLDLTTRCCTNEPENLEGNLVFTDIRNVLNDTLIGSQEGGDEEFTGKIFCTRQRYLAAQRGATVNREECHVPSLDEHTMVSK